MSDVAIVHAPESAIQREDAHILEVIARAAADPLVNVEKLERLLAMHERVRADQRRTSYMAALSAMQAELPRIGKAGRIVVKGAVQSKFARLEDLDTAIRPLTTAYGFAFTFDSEPAAGGIKFSCTMSHRDGHSETKTWTVPADASGNKNSIQAVGSATSYARRYLLAMHLHLITRDEDDDGNGGGGPVTAEQADALRAALATAGGSESRFLNWLAAASFEEIPAANYDRAMKFIEEKRRQAT